MQFAKAEDQQAARNRTVMQQASQLADQQNSKMHQHNPTAAAHAPAERGHGGFCAAAAAATAAVYLSHCNSSYLLSLMHVCAVCYAAAMSTSPPHPSIPPRPVSPGSVGVQLYAPSSPSAYYHGQQPGGSPAPVAVTVAGLNAAEISELRAYLDAKREAAEERKKNEASLLGRAKILLQENDWVTMVVKFVVTVGVAFLLGYFSLKGQVDDAKNQASALTSQVRSQQSEVAAVQLNVGALQGPVTSLVNLVTTLNVQALQTNISLAQQDQAVITAGNAQMQADFTTLRALLTSDVQLARLQTLNASVSGLLSPSYLRLMTDTFTAADLTNGNSINTWVVQAQWGSGVQLLSDNTRVQVTDAGVYSVTFNVNAGCTPTSGPGIQKSAIIRIWLNTDTPNIWLINDYKGGTCSSVNNGASQNAGEVLGGAVEYNLAAGDILGFKVLGGIMGPVGTGYFNHWTIRFVRPSCTTAVDGTCV